MRILIITVLLIVSSTVNVFGQTDVISIGVSLGLTGKFRNMGEMQEKGYRLWEKQINSNKGILGRKVKVIIKDDQSRPENVFSIYQDFMKKKQVNFVFGPYSSQLTEIAAPLAKQYEYPLLAAGAAADSIWQAGNDYIFGMWTPASQYVVGFLEMLLVYSLDDIAIISAEDSFSFGIAQGTRDWALKLGLTIKHFEKFDVTAPGLDKYIKRAQESGARVLILTGHFNEALDTRKALKSIKWQPQIFLATVGPSFEEYYRLLKTDAEGVCSISIWEDHPLLNFPGSKDFSQTFLTRYGIKPTYHAATAYAAGEILAHAIEKADSLKRQKIRSILSVMNTHSIIGRYGVDRTGLQVKRFPLCIQWQNGKKEIIWPKELSTAEPFFFQ